MSAAELGAQMGMEPREWPCEGCGIPVIIAATGEQRLASEAWGDGLLLVWCPDCWDSR
jgi:hypothetical protein